MASTKNGYLEGKLLVATPNISGGCFKQSVIYICAHSEEGAMGLIVNQTVPEVLWSDVFEQLSLPVGRSEATQPVYYGGPVEANRGFIIFEHENRFAGDTLVKMGDLAISSSIELLEKIARGEGPQRNKLLLGYSGWSPGQLEAEIEENSWLTLPFDSSILFDGNDDSKWQRASFMNGIDMAKLSPIAGHA